jgi:hypothetical protein
MGVDGRRPERRTLETSPTIDGWRWRRPDACSGRSKKVRISPLPLMGMTPRSSIFIGGNSYVSRSCTSWSRARSDIWMLLGTPADDAEAARARRASRADGGVTGNGQGVENGQAAWQGWATVAASGAGVCARAARGCACVWDGAHHASACARPY